MAGHGMTYTGCKFLHYKLLTKTKLHLKRCDYLCSGGGQLRPYGENPYEADFILEDVTIANANEIFWNNKINNLTLRGVKTDGKFSTQQCSIKESITLERLKVGTYYMNRTGTEKSITVRECYFSEVNEKTTYLFSCSGGYAAKFHMERVEATNAGAVNLTGATSESTSSFWSGDPRSQTFVIRNCRIPHLMVHWLRTHKLVIEDCIFDKLELPNSRIGSITIKNTKYATLDLTNTLAGKYDIEPSGQILSSGSDYPKGGHQLDGGKSK
jgi:hypothetical protein